MRTVLAPQPCLPHRTARACAVGGRGGGFAAVRKAIVAVLLAAWPACGARAQQADIDGTWSWQSFSQQGTIQGALMLRGERPGSPSGQFVQVVRLPVGTLVRQAGQYSMTPIDGRRFHLQMRTQSFAPHTSCVFIAGFGRRCQAVPPPPAMSDTITITSPDTMDMDGTPMQRDGQAFLLQQPVPDTSVIMGRTPVAPYMRQPVMPPMAGYTTPNGPGNVAAGQYHQQNEQWRNTYMRGCQQAENGQYYACEQ